MKSKSNYPVMTWQQWFDELEVIKIKFGNPKPPILSDDHVFEGFDHSLHINHFETKDALDSAVAILCLADGTPLPDDMDQWECFFLYRRCIHAQKLCAVLFMPQHEGGKTSIIPPLDLPYGEVLRWLLIDSWHATGMSSLQRMSYAIWCDFTGNPLYGLEAPPTFLHIQDADKFGA